MGDGCGAEDPSEQGAEEARGMRMEFNQLLDVFSQHWEAKGLHQRRDGTGGPAFFQKRQQLEPWPALLLFYDTVTGIILNVRSNPGKSGQLIIEVAGNEYNKGNNVYNNPAVVWRTLSGRWALWGSATAICVARGIRSDAIGTTEPGAWTGGTRLCHYWGQCKSLIYSDNKFYAILECRIFQVEFIHGNNETEHVNSRLS